MQSPTARLPGPVQNLRASVNGTGNFQTRGLAREELAENLTGEMDLRIRDISFGDFDPLGTLVQQAHWGKLDSVRGPVTAPLATLNVQIRDRRIILKTAAFDLSGSNLQFDGAYNFSGPVHLNVRADSRRLRRRWLAREDDSDPLARFEVVRLSGPLDHLVVNP